jgi:hypothetical protein
MQHPWQEFNAGWLFCHSWQDLYSRTIIAMYAIALLGLFVLLAIVSALGLTADSRDLRPHLPVQSRGNQPPPSTDEQFAHTALPPYRRLRTHHS